MLADDHVMLNAAATARKGFDGASLIGTFTPAGSPLIFCAEAGASTVAQLRFHGPPNARTRARYHSKMSGTLRASVQPADAIGAHCTVAYFKILGPDRFGFSMSYSPERGTEIVAESDFREFIFDPDQIGPELNGLKMAGDIELLLDIGGTFTLLVERDINVSVVDDNSSLSMGVATYDARFFDTVSWETDGPVFDLPDGWTVEGDGIINNRYFPEPTIESFAPNQGPEGISVRIRGRHFREVTSAEFGGITAAISGRGTIPGSGFEEDLDFIDANVPAGAGSGSITLRSPFGDATSEGTFTVLPLISITATDPTAAEPGLNTGQFTLTRTGGGTSVPLTVHLDISGTAGNGVDYVKRSTNATIPAGSSTLSIPIVPIDDSIAEESETVIFSILPAASYAKTPNESATVTILDNELPVVSVGKDVSFVSENGADAVDALFTVRRLGSLASSLTVNLATSGTATSGVDYLAFPATLTIFAGDDDEGIRLVTLADLNVENNETVTLTVLPDTVVAGQKPKYNVGTPSAATVTILDSSPPPTVTINNASALEGNTKGGNAIFTVRLSGSSINTVTVDWNTFTGTLTRIDPITGLRTSVSSTANSGSTCGLGTDFLAQSGRLTFLPGTTNQTLNVPFCGDTSPEFSETFFVLLAQPINASLVPFNFGTGTIANDDGSTGSFDLTPTDSTVAIHDRLNYAYTWTVPAPLNWHALEFLQLRIRDGDDTIISVLFDEASKIFVLLNEGTGEIEGGFAAGSDNRLQTPEATLYLADTTVVGSGPTGPSVTLNLSLSFKPQAAGRTFIAEVAASDDFGHQDGFTPAGALTVTPLK
jgi:hypothetical protein